MELHNTTRSLAQLLGSEYTNAVINARSALSGESTEALRAIAEEPVAFYPEAVKARQEVLMNQLGTKLFPAFEEHEAGAPTDAYRAAQHSAPAPLSGYGCFRAGEDGRLYFAGKSEHYHIPLGHDFHGYQLIENAKKLGIPNATHNNTRGYITRKLERRLIATANGLSETDPKLEAVLNSREVGVLSRVINLETGSLAVEAALKMMLARFYSLDGKPAPYADRIPVFLVMADHAGGITAGYHGTTVLAQTLRGLWPELLQKIEKSNLYRVVGVPLGNADALKEALEAWNKPPYKTAGFCHEIIMMNYGGIRQAESYLQAAYRLCHGCDTPVLCDEIQSCAWYDGLFLFRQYGLNPDFVSIGKGFPGGQYPASKVLVSGAFDVLNQFGALVTNGQEELASLAYLVTIAFLNDNGAFITQTGAYYHHGLETLVKQSNGRLLAVEGDGHMGALCFAKTEDAVAFCEYMNHEMCIDISAQTYKPNCPPVALSKLPLIVTPRMIDVLLSKTAQCLAMLEK
ncbi:MAG: aminotransferase class III-fold pyridoxal phosphate-dependent enzyme [Clostridia bacterium]